MEETKKELKFREDELVRRKFHDSRTGHDTEVVFPKVSGRLRLAHEDNEKIAIYSDIVEHTLDAATVSTRVVTGKGEFVGISSVTKDQAQFLGGAMLEFAQTKSLARALRWAGYGMEYAGAEEITESGAGEERGLRLEQPKPEPKPTEQKTIGGVEYVCEGCGTEITSLRVVDYSKDHFDGRLLCFECQKREK